MEIKSAVTEVANKFIYLEDKKTVLGDFWFVMKSQRDGLLFGDCDDFSITALWYACDRNILKFIWQVMITHQYRLYRCKTRNQGYHVIGYAEGLWFDNWTRSAVDKEQFFSRTEHKIMHVYPSPIILYFLILGFFIDQDSRLSKVQG